MAFLQNQYKSQQRYRTTLAPLRSLLLRLKLRVLNMCRLLPDLLLNILWNLNPNQFSRLLPAEVISSLVLDIEKSIDLFQKEIGSLDVPTSDNRHKRKSGNGVDQVVLPANVTNSGRCNNNDDIDENSIYGRSNKSTNVTYALRIGLFRVHVWNRE